MKKLFSILLIAMMVFLPMSASAATQINYRDCSANSDGSLTCIVTYDIDTPASNLTVTLTEQGGATITEVKTINESNWIIVNQSNVNGVWTVNLESAEIDVANQGEGDLFSFTYIPTGHTDCKIILGLGDVTTTVVPDTPSKDEPTDNKQTGSTLPYIALGIVVIGATGAYLATRNKAKMYKI